MEVDTFGLRFLQFVAGTESKYSKSPITIYQEETKKKKKVGYKFIASNNTDFNTLCV